MEHIGERIKKTRHAAKLKQKEFAQTIRMSQGSLSDLEIGRNKPSIETLVGISELYNVTIDWLIKGTGNKKNAYQMILKFHYK
ncbi:helix-turn-helix domain-containing protein [Halalkalibacter okhensis]|uniref:helix-turn-helix domain-containing protein n=1 Tax=Halalkalibacter okhensis TaxID=333138 RepID=UPI0006905E17|nr:helix-turn-helix transcriptional regulator [Halalkalibacter okhensis]